MLTKGRRQSKRVQDKRKSSATAEDMSAWREVVRNTGNPVPPSESVETLKREKRKGKAGHIGRVINSYMKESEEVQKKISDDSLARKTMGDKYVNKVQAGMEYAKHKNASKAKFLEPKPFGTKSSFSKKNKVQAPGFRKQKKK